jgi:hypothetical protein
LEGVLGMSLEGDCHEVEVTPILELLVTFGISLEQVCHDFTTLYGSDQKFLEKNSLLIRYENVMSLE